MKSRAGTVDATPQKRLFYSIIADYDLNRAISELIDNAMDIWTTSNEDLSLEINVDIDLNQKVIKITDNAGGIRAENLKFIVGPGQTTNDADSSTIGIFGVGSKRAVVALSQDIEIRSRYGSGKTLLVEITDDWLHESENWELDYFVVDNISENTTEITLKLLRIQIDQSDIDLLKSYLSQIYANFLSEVDIRLNGDKLQGSYFDDWRYPKDFPPITQEVSIMYPEGQVISGSVSGGLVGTSNQSTGEYGFYLYCNKRLVARAVKTPQVGYVQGKAGNPHATASLARVIVSLQGPAKEMPWNSSKSDVHYAHRTFVELRDTIVDFVDRFTKLSRRLNWPNEVFSETDGKLIALPVNQKLSTAKSYVMPLPPGNVQKDEKIKRGNGKLIKQKPWLAGSVDGYAISEYVYSRPKSKFPTKNRAVLILLDGLIEIAMKDYLVHEKDIQMKPVDLTRLLKKHHKLLERVEAESNLDKSVVRKIKYYHQKRNKLVHERSSEDISDQDVENLIGVTKTVMKKLLGLDLSM